MNIITLAHEHNVASFGNRLLNHIDCPTTSHDNSFNLTTCAYELGFEHRLHLSWNLWYSPGMLVIIIVTVPVGSTTALLLVPDEGQTLAQHGWTD